VEPPTPEGQQPPPPPGDQTPPPTYEQQWPAAPPQAPPPSYDATAETTYPSYWNQQNLPPAYATPPKSGTNGFAIAALVFGIIPICFLGVIFAIVALVQTSKSGQKGKGFAIAGLVLSALWLAGGVTVAVVNGLNSADRDSSTGTIKTAGRLHVYDLKVGDCFNDKAEPGKLANTVPAVPCSQPHSAEVFAVVPAKGSSFPGDAAMNTQAQNACTDRMDAVDSKQVPHDAELHWFRPTEIYWKLNHRDIACMVVTQTKRAGSLLN